MDEEGQVSVYDGLKDSRTCSDGVGAGSEVVKNGPHGSEGFGDEPKGERRGLGKRYIIGRTRER